MMSTQQSGSAAAPARSSLYLYAFGEADLTLPQGITGLNDSPLSLLSVDSVTAVVSPIASGRLRPERRHLAAHQGVLAKIMTTTTVLPVTFGMVVPSAGKLKRMLTPEIDSLVEQLDAVRGRVEMAIRLTWDVPNIFQYFVEQEPALRAARDTMLAQEGNHHAKVAAGELFGKIIATRRHEHELQLLSIIEAAADEIQIEPPKSDSEILRVAALVARDNLGAFEAKLNEAADIFDSACRFDYSGPWAPHSFVSLRISAEQTAEAA